MDRYRAVRQSREPKESFIPPNPKYKGSARSLNAFGLKTMDKTSTAHV
ncbi:MAG: hypothetical protein V3U65_11360 [Granulosicoccaceae bacterium]